MILTDTILHAADLYLVDLPEFSITHDNHEGYSWRSSHFESKENSWHMDRVSRNSRSNH